MCGKAVEASLIDLLYNARMNSDGTRLYMYFEIER